MCELPRFGGVFLVLAKVVEFKSSNRPEGETKTIEGMPLAIAPGRSPKTLSNIKLVMHWTLVL